MFEGFLLWASETWWSSNWKEERSYSQRDSLSFSILLPKSYCIPPKRAGWSFIRFSTISNYFMTCPKIDSFFSKVFFPIIWDINFNELSYSGDLSSSNPCNKGFLSWLLFGVTRCFMHLMHCNIKSFKSIVPGKPFPLSMKKGLNTWLETLI
jgi:hypothetical protein